MANEIGLKQGCIMHCLFEITKDDVALLSDADLRELVGRLCEADYRSAGLPTSGIRYGGHQDARDGGLDVVVNGEVAPPKTSYVPRCNTGFQVKKSNMPRGKILKEMRPKGVLRESIGDLARLCGAYIIVSQASSSYSSLKERNAAMRKAVADALGRFGQREGVWVSEPLSAIPLAVALREQLVAVNRERMASVGKNEKMETLYQYLAGTEFKQKIEGIVEAFTSMQSQLNQERRAMERHWKQREKQIHRVVKNTVGLYGDMQGIIGGQIPTIPALELDGDEAKQLPESTEDGDVDKVNESLDGSE
jgi:hypothetical protein